MNGRLIKVGLSVLGVIIALVALELILRFFVSKKYTEAELIDWVVIDFGRGNERRVTSIMAMPRPDHPDQFWREAVFEGSRDGVSFGRIAEIDQTDLPQDGKWLDWHFKNSERYRFYRVAISNGQNKSNGDFYSFAELRLLVTDETGPEKASLSSNEFVCTTSSHQGNYGSGNLVDGDVQTFWHVDAVSKKARRRLEERLRRRTEGLTGFFERDPVLGWRGRPNTKGTQRRYLDCGPFYIEHNAGGFRDSATAYKKDKFRILFLADSMGWGVGVNQKDLFSEVLEGMFAGKAEVVNCAVPGYGTDQELLFLKREGIKYNSDLVVLMVAYNDPIDNLMNFTFLPDIVFKPRFQLGKDQGLFLTTPNVPYAEGKGLAVLDSPQESWWIRMRIQLRKHSVLYATIVDRLMALSIPSVGPEQWLVKLESEGWPLTRAILLDMASVLKENDIKFLVAITPPKQAVRMDKDDRVWSPYLERLSTLLGEFCHSLGVDFIDPTDVFRECEGNKRLHFDIDAHWTAEGHALFAKCLYSCILKKYPFLVKEGQNN